MRRVAALFGGDPRHVTSSDTWICRHRSVGATITASLAGCVVVGSLGCLSVDGVDGSDKDAPTLVARAQEFHSLVKRGQYETARAMMSENPRRWWENRDGEGKPWRIGLSTPGPWAAWDEHFRSQTSIVQWKEQSRSATAVVRETNDYFRLLERGWVTNEITYFFDESGRIDGLLIRAAGVRPAGRTDEFLAWARAHDLDELAALMPGGEIDPSADHPERFRRLLNRWRQASGLKPIE